ncbi:Uncharacterised protein [Nocardia otitidiscaviarum]|uniref:Uncharacterized protein n=1 Tax=Nocardia otitidiscaviarum TaxID=1823 RepID=A0A378YA98_9NOCA|nr:Uncharacterised protein [Nocardia otitidiscaviarum]
MRPEAGRLALPAHRPAVGAAESTDSGGRAGRISVTGPDGEHRPAREIRSRGRADPGIGRGGTRTIQRPRPATAPPRPPVDCRRAPDESARRAVSPAHREAGQNESRNLRVTPRPDLAGRPALNGPPRSTVKPPENRRPNPVQRSHKPGLASGETPENHCAASTKPVSTSAKPNQNPTRSVDEFYGPFPAPPALTSMFDLGGLFLVRDTKNPLRWHLVSLTRNRNRRDQRRWERETL